MVDMDNITRDDVIAMFKSDAWEDNAMAVVASLYLGLLDDEVCGLVGGFSGSNLPVPFDRTVGDVVEEYMSAVEDAR